MAFPFERISTRPRIATLTILAALSLAANAGHVLSGDIAWSLDVADQMAAGRVIYREIFDINPPLIFWFAAAARWAGETVGVAAQTAYFALTATIGLGSIYAARTW